MSLIGTRSRKLNESGQGVIEYILVLTTTVFLIGTFLYQFSTAFRKYANNFFGEYVACLMETGELPGQAKSECKDALVPFNLTDGKSSTGKDVAGVTGGVGAGAGGNGSGSGTGSGSGGSSKNGKGGKSGSGSSDSSGGSGGSNGPPVGELNSNGRGEGDDSFGGGGRRRSTSIKSTASNTGSDGAGGKARAGLKPVGAYSNTTSGGGLNDSRGKRRALDRGYGFMGQEEQERREDERPASKPVAKDGGEGLRPKKVSVNTARAPAAAKDEGGGGFSLGNVLRILIIAGILVAIFILFGSQLLAISKSGEK